MSWACIATDTENIFGLEKTSALGKPIMILCHPVYFRPLLGSCVRVHPAPPAPFRPAPSVHVRPVLSVHDRIAALLDAPTQHSMDEYVAHRFDASREQDIFNDDFHDLPDDYGAPLAVIRSDASCIPTDRNATQTHKTNMHIHMNE